MRVASLGLCVLLLASGVFCSAARASEFLQRPGQQSIDPAGGAGIEPREIPPEEQADKAYKAGLKSIKKAEGLETEAAAAGSDSKRDRLRERAIVEYDRALELFEIVVGNRSDSAEAWNYIGIADQHMRALPEALEAYDHAIFINPKFYDAIEHRAETYLELNRIEDAKSAYGDLFDNARPLVEPLTQAMKRWVASRRSDPQGVPAAQLDEFQHWLDQRAAAGP